MNLYDQREEIGKNLSLFIFKKGYSKSSFSKIMGISRSTLNQIVSGESQSPTIFRDQISNIAYTFNVLPDYFLSSPNISEEKWQLQIIPSSRISLENDRRPLAKELLEDLNQLIMVAGLYL